MATSVIGIWTQQGGYAEVLAFRRNPSLYLNTRKIDEETFAHYILQALCQDTVPAGIKIHLLNDLQEYAAIILPSTTSAEEIVASLLDIFHQISAKDGPSVFRGQILVSATSIAIQFDFNEKRLELFAKLVETLLEVVCHTGTVADGHLRTIACCCLQELETCLPCMLQNKLEYIYQLSQMEHGTAAQGYLLLLVTILRHAVGQLRLQEAASLHTNTLETLLTDRTEPLKPYILPKITSDCLLTQKVAETGPLVNLDLTEMRRLVSYVIDYAPLLTPTGHVYALLTLARTIIAIPNISPSVFKLVVMRNASSFDLGYISLLLALQDGYGAILVDGTDTTVLFRTLVTGTVHPGMTAAQRFILMEWLTELTQVAEDPGWPGTIGVTLLTRIFPRTFDGCELQLKKLHLMSRILPSYLPDSEVEEVLCTCLQLVQGAVESGLGGRPATILFRALYLIYEHLPNRQLVDSIVWILIRLGQHHSRLALRVLNLVEVAQTLEPNNELGGQVLLSLLSSITTATPNDLDLNQIQHHLVVLHRIASEFTINPMEIVNYMQKLVAMDAICSHGNWETGSSLLSVCRSLLAQHNVNEIFVSLGHVLHHLSQHHADVDIRDRAAFYYTLQCSLSPQNVTSLLSLTTPSGRDTQGLAVMVTQKSSLSGVRPVKREQEPLLRLARMQQMHQSTIPPVKTEETLAENLEEYFTYLRNTPELGRIKIDFYLHFDTDSTENIEELFALELHFNSHRFYKTISDLQIPWVMKLESACPGPKCCNFRLMLEPTASVPIMLKPEAVFTTRDGQTWRAPVAGVDITLEDLWRPLPVNAQNAEVLYKLLWASMLETSDSIDGPLETIVCLNMDEATLTEHLRVQWKSLVIDTKTLLSTVPAKFTPKLRSVSDAEDPQNKVYHLAMFLPPKHHVLMELKPAWTRTVVSITTDHAEVLPLLTEYLESFERHEE